MPGADYMAREAPIAIEESNVRSWQHKDQAAVARLFEGGLLSGQVAPNDTGADIEHIRDAYFDDERHHFWVAEVDGQVVGMIGIAGEEDHTAEIRRLRVAPEFQDTNVAETLLTVAVEHCRQHGFLKVRLDTRFQRDAAVDLFDSIGFQHTRTKSVPGKELLEFYLDLYRQPVPDDS